MLDHDNRENYLDPVLHDLESSPFEAEGSWLLELAQSVCVRLALRYFMPQEVETLLYENGLRVLTRHADWQGNPVAPDSDMQVYVCARR